MTAPIRCRDWKFGVTGLALTGAIGLVLTLQGWKARIPYIDMVAPMDNARRLVTLGDIPRWGHVNSLESYSPPGTAWLLLPGVSCVKDPRLFEYFGAGFLHLGTLVGLFLLARSLFGLRCAIMASVLYGLSELGLYYAGSLWPKGHPFFYVWTLYLISQWTIQKDSRYLGAAIFLLAIGTYVHLELLPLLFIVPAVWAIYHPPLRPLPVLIGMIVGVAIWFPYLTFESSRGFSDITSQLFMKNGLPIDTRVPWCDPKVSLARWRPDIPIVNQPKGRRITNLEKGLAGNFERTLPLPGISFVLLGLVLGGLVAIAITRHRPLIDVLSLGRSSRWSGCLRTVLGRFPWHQDADLMVLFLVIPWVLLLFGALHPQHLVATRFWWLWPAQIVVIAAITTGFTARTIGARLFVWLGQVAIVLVVAGNPLVLSRLQSWSLNGWAGLDSDEKRVVDYIAGELLSRGKYQASLGYNTFFSHWIPERNILDKRMKVGAEFDLLLRSLYGIENTNFCAEGLSSNDEYLVVQTAPSIVMVQPFGLGKVGPNYYVSAKPYTNFQPLANFGPYVILKRKLKASKITDE
jgi:hypothetical protein